MPVSSLIFVVIVAIWAAYLVQHWVRRREDAAATRSVDGFTEAMRVLEKRTVLTSTELRTPRPHSYAVQPARVARPTVDVKRAVPAGASRRNSPLVARRAETAAATVGRTDHAIAPHAAEVNRMPESARQPIGHDQTRRDGRTAAPAPTRVPVGQRRLRAALLLAAVAWVPVSIGLAITGVLLWVTVPFAVATVVAVLFWLRAEAQADRRRAAEGGHGRRTGDRSERAHRQPTPSIDDTQVIRGAATHVEAETGDDLAPAATARPAGAGVFDVQAPVTGEVPVAAAAVVGPLPEGSWSPVPVPRPTYALKAKAEPRYTEGGIPADVFDTPEFADEADELDDRALFARRAVSQ